MNLTQRHIILLLFLAGCAMLSCKRRTEPLIGGKGGKAVINATPQHHGRNIDSCTIYIKYNATDLPATFDDSVVCKKVNGAPVATFTGLKPGQYYLYGRGWDDVIEQKVKDGKGYQITEEKTYTVYVPVSE